MSAPSIPPVSPVKELEELVERLAAALASGLPPALAREGWALHAVGLRFLMGRDLPVVALARAGASLCFIVTPTDPQARVYRRTRHLDVVYFSEDVPDDQQQGVYDRHRGTIDAFVAWLSGWDAAGGSSS